MDPPTPVLNPRDGVLSDEDMVRTLWPLYFDSTDPAIGGQTWNTCILFVERFRENWKQLIADLGEDLATIDDIPIDVSQLIDIEGGNRDILKMLLGDAETVLSQVGLALAVVRHNPRYALSDSTIKVMPRFFNLPDSEKLRNLKAQHMAQFVQIRANVVRATDVRPKVLSMEFTCTKCGEPMLEKFSEGRYVTPARCTGTVGPGGNPCKSRTFEPSRSSARTMDSQTIKLQEFGGDSMDPGRMPRTINCELEDTLCGTCVPGDVVTVTGIVKAMSADEANGKGKRHGAAKTGLHLLYLGANTVIRAGGSQKAGESKQKRKIDGDDKEGSDKLDIMEFTKKDIKMIIKVCDVPHLFEFIVGSLVPDIFGNELVKAGLILTMFGGTQNYGGDKGNVAVRGDPHILIVGDPGLGKSQMLKACVTCAPRGVYVCGNTTSSSGLTVSVVKDPGTKGFNLEAGALVLGDHGVCCIDEFDKMSKNEHNSLLEAMEQQSISIAKGGIVASLSAHTSVIAAANPAGGHYNRAKTVNENLRLGGPLLSRFDLIFILMDKANAQKDELLSKHIIQLHSSHGDAVGGNQFRRNVSGTNTLQGAPSSGQLGLQAQERRAALAMFSQANSVHSRGVMAQGGKQDRTLAARLRDHALDNTGHALPLKLLRKYIAYARKFCKPKLSTEAALKLREFYLDLRSKGASTDTSPITTRQLEALVRLAEARAKVELRTTVTAADAEDVIEIMRESLLDACTDDFGIVDFGMAGGMSKAKQIKTFMSALNRSCRERGTAVFTTDELKHVAENIGVVQQIERSGGTFYDLIDMMNQQCYLLKKGPRKWQVQTSDYSNATPRFGRR